MKTPKRIPEHLLLHMEDHAEHAQRCLGGYTKNEEEALGSFARDATTWVPLLIRRLRYLETRNKLRVVAND